MILKLMILKIYFILQKMILLFFIQKNIKNFAKKTKASFCITTESLKNELPKNCVPLIVENVLVSVSKITSIILS